MGISGFLAQKKAEISSFRLLIGHGLADICNPRLVDLYSHSSSTS